MELTDKELDILTTILPSANDLLEYLFSDYVDIDEDDLYNRLDWDTISYQLINYGTTDEQEYLIREFDLDTLKVFDKDILGITTGSPDTALDEYKKYICTITNNLDKRRMLEYLIDNINSISLEGLEYITKNNIK